MHISDSEILAYIAQDLPYFDLTTSLQDVKKQAVLKIFTRQEVVVSCADIAARVAKLLGCEAKIFIQNTQKAKPNDMIVQIFGSYSDVHKAWKLAQIMLEYTCKIATYTNQMTLLAKAENEKCEILTTRKSFPFAKKLCLKAVIEGGGGVHRLGLSDSILFFKNHIIAYANFNEFLAQIPSFKAKMPERKIAVEAESLDQTKELLKAGVDVVQCDKFSPQMLENAVALRDEIYPTQG
ncbi:ModD protein [Campylobacter suis]|uniref:Nicotinate-nucleotide pyrophosphorylase [carboxylating] n=1 Tax=Campylobacter suis TaxID=2790657 RepID=A0ABM8Q1T0_9BACT|nr:ModD protein [Campylobacter suis]CAD7286735.1 putative nicotinate-nucleotide pyrophosphorylase [carboxylating] [Campylobacter suis]